MNTAWSLCDSIFILHIEIGMIWGIKGEATVGA